MRRAVTLFWFLRWRNALSLAIAIKFVSKSVNLQEIQLHLNWQRRNANKNTNKSRDSYEISVIAKEICSQAGIGYDTTKRYGISKAR